MSRKLSHWAYVSLGETLVQLDKNPLLSYKEVLPLATLNSELGLF